MIKTITYSKMGFMGRLGNQMFEIASCYGMGRTYGRHLVLPIWKYQPYFDYQIPLVERGDFKDDVNEEGYHFTPFHWDAQMKLKEKSEVVSVCGWLQSPMYWKGYEKEVRGLFRFTDQWKASILEQWLPLLENGKETIAISVRVGQDYKDNGNYEILPITYYINALYDKFEHWNNGNYNILIFSDDVEYCKLNFQGPEFSFAIGSDVEQLCLMTQCKHFILANSTFSWWGAYLGESEGSKVVYPDKYFKNSLAGNSVNDFWPQHWEPCPYSPKLDLSDVTFTIPVTYDSGDRQENLEICVAYLNKHYNTNILVGEQGGIYFRNSEEYDYIPFNYKTFHRTKILNDMANEANTPIIVNQDVDVLVPVLQMYKAVLAVRGGAAMVYPYDGRFARVVREDYIPIIKKELDCGYFKKPEPFRGTREFDPPSVGGVIVWSKENFIYGGMENERMINYGPEDVERKYRFEKLGYRVERINGICYHLDHWVGPNSGGGGNPYMAGNNIELARIQKMDNIQLLEEINTWEWVNNYLSSYYEEITDGAILSAKEVFSVLETHYDMKKVKKIIDVGCGVGAWSHGAKKYIYKGVDYKLPKHKLIIPRENYSEYDLRSNDKFPFSDQFDLALCLEVAEHLPKESAKKLIHLLCRLAPVVLFSAAIPHQGGNQHYNEQFQSYWAQLFAGEGYYQMIPLLRSIVKENKKIDTWYRQNMVVYSKDGTPHIPVEDYILPEMYMNIIGTLTDWK